METTHPIQTATWAVHGMHCTSCSIVIDEAVEDLEGVTSSSTSLKKRLTTVTFDASRCDPEQIAAAIAEAGYQAIPTTNDAPGGRRSWFGRTTQ